MSPLTEATIEFSRQVIVEIRKIISTVSIFIVELPQAYFHTVCTVEEFQPIIRALGDMETIILDECTTPCRLMNSVSNKLYNISYELHNIKRDFEDDIDPKDNAKTERLSNLVID
jgi:hypothetical protein